MSKPTQPQYSDLLQIATRLSLTLVGDPVFGWHGKSVGSATATGSWLRVVSRRGETAPGQDWFGEEQADVYPMIPKPRLIKSVSWRAGDTVFRVDELTLVPGSPISRTSHLEYDPHLPVEWWTALSESLEQLSQITTDRVAVRQDLISRRIHERYGKDVDAVVTNWATAHGDLHWANLFGPELCIIDWEAWGLAPQGYDAALLLGFSLLQPASADLVRRQFGHLLDTPDGRLSQLFVCAELLRMIELHSDHPVLQGPLEALAHSLL